MAKPEFKVESRRLDAHRSEARCKAFVAERAWAERNALKRGAVRLCMGGGQGIAPAIEIP